MEIFWFIVAIVGIAIYSVIQKANVLQAAKNAYLESLSELKDVPGECRFEAAYISTGPRIFESYSRQQGHHRVR